jgi:rubrerythrin
MHPSTSTYLFLAVLTLLAFGALPASAAPTDDVVVGSTLDNMQAAFNGESNARARYLAFAQKADEEGYKTVATLFRAAAEAEGIHAANHAKVITDLGGQPKAEISKPEVKTTAENLAAAIAGESYERDKMYPAFLKLARSDGDAKAVRSLNFAKSAEAEHAALYQRALDNLDAWKDGETKFYVCPKCGKTVTTLDSGKCSVCNTKDKNFKMIA